MKKLSSDALRAFIPIFLSALAAAALTFIQSLAHQSGFCPAPVVTGGETALVGAAFKATHTAYLLLSHPEIV